MINILQGHKVYHCTGVARPQTLDEEGEAGSEEEDYQDDQQDNTESLLASAVNIQNQHQHLDSTLRFSLPGWFK